jgi:hypothetical protein
VTDEDKDEAYGFIASYVIRRALCGLSPKNYNKIFARLAGLLASKGISAKTLASEFSDLKGDAVRFGLWSASYLFWCQLDAGGRRKNGAMGCPTWYRPLVSGNSACRRECGLWHSRKKSPAASRAAIHVGESGDTNNGTLSTGLE